jgi:hypothetical protein
MLVYCSYAARSLRVLTRALGLTRMPAQVRARTFLPLLVPFSLLQRTALALVRFIQKMRKGFQKKVQIVVMCIALHMHGVECSIDVPLHGILERCD